MCCIAEIYQQDKFNQTSLYDVSTLCFIFVSVGPFIIYEYCEHGPLKDYLQSHRSNVTLEVQESLFRFGLAIAKGMEYLASKTVSLSA